MKCDESEVSLAEHSMCHAWKRFDFVDFVMTQRTMDEPGSQRQCVVGMDHFLLDNTYGNAVLLLVHNI